MALAILYFCVWELITEIVSGGGKDYTTERVSGSSKEDWYSARKIESIERWVELRDPRVRANKLNLSYQHMAFVNQSLSFQFPFYGEDFKEIMITTQGYISLTIFMSDTQYIAPLMADFKPLPNKSSPTQEILLLATSDTIVIQWSGMLLAKQSPKGQFDFQLQLTDSGTIYMVYKAVPIPFDEIVADDHVLKAGISGGHAEGQTIPMPYDTVDLRNLTSNSTYILKPLATCIDQKNCSSCTSWNRICYWCESLQQCSTGQDRLKDKWQQAGCPMSAVKECRARSTIFGTSHPFTHYSMTASGPSGRTRRPYVTSDWARTTPEPPDPTKPTTNATTVNQNYTVVPHVTEDRVTEDKPSVTTPPASPVSLPAIYVILIVASSLSFILVLSAFIILAWHKRRLRLSSTLTSCSRPDTNNLLSNGSSHGSSSDPVKCLPDNLAHI